MKREKKKTTTAVKKRKRRNDTLMDALVPREELEKRLPMELIQAEVHLEKLPFFLPEKSRRKHKKLVHAVELINKQNLKARFEVSANAKYGMPNYFDRDVYRAIQKIIKIYKSNKSHEVNEFMKRIANENDVINYETIVPFTRGMIARILKIKKSGADFTRIKDSVDRIAATTIQSDNAIWLKADQKYLKSKTLHVFQAVIWQGEEVDGDTSEKNYIVLSDWYYKNLTAGYIKPLDFNYYFSLRWPMSRALYSYLSVNLYPFRNKEKQNIPYQKSYKQLCKEMMLSRQRYFSKAKQIFEKARKELIDTEFLANMEYVHSETDSSDFVLHFSPGRRVFHPEEFRTIRQLDLPLAGDTDEDPLTLAADKIIRDFHKRHNGKDKQRPTKGELLYTESLIKEQGLETVKFVVNHAMNAMAATKFYPRHFTAIKSYVEEAIFAYERNKKSERWREEKSQKEAAKTEEEERQRAEKMERLEEYLSALSTEEINTYKQEFENNLTLVQKSLLQKSEWAYNIQFENFLMEKARIK